jgi:hypothetical protein
MFHSVMRLLTGYGLFVLGALASQVWMAPAFGGTPAGSTGVCKDGTYTKAASKRGACQGHRGVKTWFADDESSLAVDPDANANAIRIAGATPPGKASVSTQKAHAGGGPEFVWLDRSAEVYYCYGSAYYGKTNIGVYVSEGTAKATGASPSAGKACPK